MKLIDPNDIPFHSAPIAPLYPNGHLVDYEWHVNYKWVAYQHDIKRIKRIEAEPVVHAHWYFDPDKSIGCGITVSGMFCSNCGSDCPTGSHPYRDFKYCPHCGAKMMDEIEKERRIPCSENGDEENGKI